MAARIIAVYSGGALQALQSSTATIDFASVRIGASNLPISESSGKFDFGGKILGNILAATTSGQAIEYDQLQSALSNYIAISEKGANNGVATLDAGGKIPVAQLPNSVMEFLGQYNATTNFPALVDGTGNAGDVYRVNVAGTQDFGAGNITFAIGDWVMYSGSVWQKASNSNDVVSVNGQQGVVVLTTSDIAEGTNLYYTAARFNTAFGTKTTTDLSEGTNLYYTAARFNTAFATKSTSDLAEGSNLYYTQARFDSAFAAKSTSDLAEGSNLYYTSVRALADIQLAAQKTLQNDNVAASTARQVVYIKSNGHFDLAKGDIASINSFAIGLSVGGIPSGSTGQVWVGSGVVVGGFTSLTPGAIYYLSAATAGAITLTPPSASGQSVYQVGRAVSATELEFLPKDVIEIL